MATIKFCNLTLAPSPVEGGFLLKSDASPRVFLVNAEGVYECARDGSDKPLILMDCGDRTLRRVKAALGDRDAAASLAKEESERRIKMLKDAAEAAVKAGMQQIAAADAAKEKAK